MKEKIDRLDFIKTPALWNYCYENEKHKPTIKRKEFLQLNNMKQAPQFKNLQNIWVDTSPRRIYRWLVSTQEKAMAPHSSTLAWKIPWMEEPGRLQSMGSLRVRHDWETSLSFFTFMHWRRKWQPTPVFLPGESQGRGSLVGCRLWGCTESDMTEVT